MRVAASAADSHVGRKRRHNEDAYVHAPPLFAVADGMGGAQAGEVASALATEAVLAGSPTTGQPNEQRVVELIREANRRVHERALTDATASGMGTTMTVAVFDPAGTVTIGHVGDSRAYLFRNGTLAQLTDDHSLVAELVRRGELTPEEAETHPQRSVITRALGTEREVAIDAFTVPVSDGDVLLLCSDGLTTMVDGESLARLLGDNQGDVRAAARALIAEANNRGGDDNITTVLFQIGSGDEPLSTETPQAAGDLDEVDTLHPEDRVAIPTDHDRVTLTVSGGDTGMAVGGSESAPSDPPVPRTRMAFGVLAIVALAAIVVFLVLEKLPR